MTEDDIDRLHAALRRARAPFEAAYAEIVDLDKRLDRVQRALRGHGHRSHEALKPGFVPGSSDWIDDLPTREEMTAILARWYESRQALLAAYKALPEAERRHVAYLPGGVR